MSSEPGKTFTLIIVNNRRGSTRRLVLSSGVLKAALTLGFVLALVGASVVVDYLGLLVQSVENRRLTTENERLRDQFQIVEGKVVALESSLERVKSFVTKLKTITNVDSEDRALQLAIGPLPKTGQSVPGLIDPSGRTPAALPHVGRSTEEETALLDRPTANPLEGELTVEGQRDYAALAIRIDQAVRETALRETGILELWEALSERQSLLAATPSIRPVRGWFTSKFGYRISPFTGRPVMHSGLDIAAQPGAPIYAPADGIVSFAGFDPGYGKLVSIDHGYGVVTRYGHASQLFVEVGQKVKRRDIIAAVGNTGRSTGPHLHYEVRINGIPVDPIHYVLDE